MNTRDQLIDATAELLWERGYSATSPAMIQKRAGVGQGSMYHHFTGKADLAAAAMRRVAAQMRAEVLAAIDGRETVIDRLHAYLDLERRPLLGCRLGRLVQDPDVVAQAELSQVALEFFAWLRRWVTDELTTGQRRGELRPDFEPAEVAALLVATIQGGYVLARAERDPDVQTLAIAGAKRLIRDLIAHPAQS